jgi:translation initiation factor 1 (eIF-1/SUI1)
MNISVFIVRIGDLNSEDLEYLEEELRAKFGNCTVRDGIQIP